jgi:hypothetical protein
MNEQITNEHEVVDPRVAELEDEVAALRWWRDYAAKLEQRLATSEGERERLETRLASIERVLIKLGF